MKVKNVKMIEQHAEKMVLAVAVAAAAYLAYSAFSAPVTVDHNGTPVKASEVTREVSASVENLRRDLEKNSVQSHPVEIENFVEKYNAIANQPLPEDLQHGVASFTALNMGPPAGVGPGGPVNSSRLAIVTPVVPPPTDLTAEVSRGSITLTPAPAPGAPPAPAPDLKDIKDAEWVMLKANYPVAKLIHEMTLAQNRIPSEAQRYTFARLEVERQKQNSDGTWSNKWEAVPSVASVQLPPAQLAANADPDTVKKVLDDLDAAWASVLRPAFYRLVVPALQIAAPRPVAAAGNPGRRGGAPQPIPGVADTAGLGADVDSAIGTITISNTPTPPPRAAVAPRPAAPKPAPVLATPVPAPAPAPAPAVVVDAPPEASPAVAASGPEQTHAAILQEENAPVWFYDEHVKGGERYRYRMRITIFNPLFHLDMQLRDPNAKNQPWLHSEWALLPDPITIGSNHQMFVVHSLNAKPNAASFRIYRWQYGHWFPFEDSFFPGETVGKTRKPGNFTEPIDFDTGYTVVAVDTEKSGETRVVLQGPGGELVTRDSRVDFHDPELRKLDEQNSRESAPATQPAPSAGL